MNLDTELETWRQEWRDQTEPLPELKKKIQRQNRQTYTAFAAVAACLAGSIAVALSMHNAFAAGMATGLAATALIVGGFAWRVGRGVWRPTAQTTLAYAELSHRRAVAKARTLHFGFWFLLVATATFAALAAWQWSHVHLRDGVILALLVAELFFLKNRERRKLREIDETRKLVDEIRES